MRFGHFSNIYFIPSAVIFVSDKSKEVRFLSLAISFSPLSVIFLQSLKSKKVRFLCLAISFSP